MGKLAIIIIVLFASACAPSANTIQTAIAQTQAASPTITPVPTIVIVETQVPELECYFWDQVDRSIEGEDVCVFGDMLYKRSIQDSDGNHLYWLIRFAQAASKFYIVSTSGFWNGSNFSFSDLKAGDCITVFGELEFDNNGWPFIKDGVLSEC